MLFFLGGGGGGFFVFFNKLHEADDRQDMGFPLTQVTAECVRRQFFCRLPVQQQTTPFHSPSVCVCVCVPIEPTASRARARVRECNVCLCRSPQLSKAVRGLAQKSGYVGS